MNLRLPELEKSRIDRELFYKIPSPLPIPKSQHPIPEKQPDLEYHSNLLYASIVNETLSEPDSDPFIRAIFQEHFRATHEEPELVHVDLIPFPDVDSGMNPTVYSITSYTKTRPFPKADLVRVMEELTSEMSEARTLVNEGIQLIRNRSYSLPMSETHETSELQDMLYDIARENR